MALNDLLLSHGTPMLVALVAWWFSTGAVLWLVRRPVAAHGIVLATAAVATLAIGVAWRDAGGGAGADSAYAGFFVALSLWALIEIAFLTGVVTGPRRAPCPPDARGWRRFRLATATLIHHELAILMAGLMLSVSAWGQPTPVAAWTFWLLAFMRLSTKLNIFLGVANVTEEFLPPQLAHLPSYFRRSSFNPLFPISLAASLGLAVLFAVLAAQAPAGSAAQTGASLLLALTLLGLIEHGFLMWPVGEAALWRWALPNARKQMKESANLSHRRAADPAQCPLKPQQRLVSQPAETD